MSEDFVPHVCPFCDRFGTVVFEKSMHRAVSRGRYKGETRYEHHECYCKECGESFVPGGMMNGNLHRMREAFERLELRTCYCPLCDKHFEVRSNESHGSCPDCGHHVVLRIEEDNDG